MNTMEPASNGDFPSAPTPADGRNGAAAAPGNARRSAEFAIEVRDLHCAYGRTEAVNGLSFTVAPGRCYGLFGRNGAGKSTTIKCLLNLLRPRSGSIRVNGVSPQQDELAVKHMIGYVPEQVAFHPWMTVERVLRYYAAFRPTWNHVLERELLTRFDLERTKKVDAMSKGMRSQLGLICAVCPEPQILLLDEPTSGLDPIIRREFLQTVIGAYMEAAPGQRTVLVSTHLIGEWEGLIDEFTIVDKGRALLRMQTDDAREKCRRIYLRWTSHAATDGGAAAENKPFTVPADLGTIERADGPLIRLVTINYSAETESRLQDLGAQIVEVEPLSLEDIFVALSGTRAAPEASGAAK
jgi:ABC-2 type transport system ATP-binding protein